MDSRAESTSFKLFEALKVDYPTCRHVTDVTNASRTMLMDIASLQWSQELKDFFQLPSGIHLPKIQVPTKTSYCYILKSLFRLPPQILEVWPVVP